MLNVATFTKPLPILFRSLEYPRCLMWKLPSVSEKAWANPAEAVLHFVATS
jgi:hypothetical protein